MHPFAVHPFIMTPAYRHGADTPWGGVALRTLFGKQIPDDTTGESLEISALPGLCSRDAQGRPLDELLRRGGTAMRGTRVGEPFPLLVKLIHARERLSVQVHPGDAYAAAHEGGKLGKTEAWVVLDAPAGAQLVYGIRPGITREELARAAARGREVENCLRWVPVSPGDALFIPAGTVHAIGEGIVLYEIQQSSDVTYRFWDWDRRDAQGKPRELHLKQALEVADVSLRLEPCRGEPERAPGGTRARLIADPAFMLERLEVGGAAPGMAPGMILEESPERFRLLTALCGGRITFSGGVLAFKPGDSIFVPASAGRITLACEGALLLAAPG
ncbi:MAG: class I mannose-6-phosphate isomerase [Clostridia bacterium]|nr:class I mannose-6-phosphate isomerase [Clostridia bacterium]